MKVLGAILILLLLGLQYQAWFGDNGYFAALALNKQLALQERQAASQKQRNSLLRGEVMEMNQGNAAVEARAREDLGMVKEDEVFYVVIDGTR